jgi:hypothetical protein
MCTVSQTNEDFLSGGSSHDNLQFDQAGSGVEGQRDAPNRSSGALKALGGKATGAQIADYVEEKKLLKTDMDTRQAISWILSYAVRLELLKAKESQ